MEASKAYDLFLVHVAEIVSNKGQSLMLQLGWEIAEVQCVQVRTPYENDLQRLMNDLWEIEDNNFRTCVKQALTESGNKGYLHLLGEAQSETQLIRKLSEKIQDDRFYYRLLGLKAMDSLGQRRHEETPDFFQVNLKCLQKWSNNQEYLPSTSEKDKIQSRVNTILQALVDIGNARASKKLRIKWNELLNRSLPFSQEETYGSDTMMDIPT
ncbi:DgyrCDS9929 [Dimorphilus gyrociliatus]|uniref:DgyrCDS9929 n=1 Tax=Dimorphilus gyrociliatus TaxID=2664684 RepID=A0A7I8W171_9ANNE|nr:DgyrCDS9929 [Dimorphilus gyrociliatus]